MRSLWVNVTVKKLSYRRKSTLQVTTRCTVTATNHSATLQVMSSNAPATSIMSPLGYMVVPALSLFTLITYDVASPTSSHILQPIDLAVHQAVVDNIPLGFRIFTADKIISNIPIAAGALGSVAALQIVLWKDWKKGAFLFSLLGGLNFLSALYRLLRLSTGCSQHVYPLPWSSAVHVY